MDPSISVAPTQFPTPPGQTRGTSHRRMVPRTAWDGYWKGALLVVLVMYAFITLRAHDLIPFIGKLRPSLITMVVGLGLLYTRSATRVRRSALRDKSVRLAMVYVAWVLITTPTALWPGQAFVMFRVAVVGAAVLVACAFVRPSRANVFKIQKLMVWGGGIVAVAALVNGENDGGRLYMGTLYDPNDFGALLGAMIMLAAGLALRARGKEKLITFACMAPMGVAMLQTGSRGVLVGFGVGVLALTFGYRGKRLAIVLLGLLAGLIVAGTQVDVETRERLFSVFALENDYNFTENTGRVAIWTRGIGYMQQRPLLGAGAGNFPMADGHHYDMLGQPGKWQAAHNTYVEAGVELGIPGLIILLMLHWSALKRAFRYWRPRRWMRNYDGHNPEILAAFLAYLTSAMFLSHAYMVIQFFLIGLIVLNDRSLMGPRAQARAQARGRGPTRGVPQAGPGRA